MVNIPLGFLTTRQLIELIKEASEVLLTRDDICEVDKELKKVEKKEYPKKESKLPIKKKTRNRKTKIDYNKIDEIIENNTDKGGDAIFKEALKEGINVSRSLVYKRKNLLKEPKETKGIKKWKYNQANVTKIPAVSAGGETDD